MIKNRVPGNPAKPGIIRRGKRLRKQSDLKNKRFGRLVALYNTGEKMGSSYLWHCRCDCGNEIDTSVNQLNSGMTKSCGCIKNEKLKIVSADNIVDRTNVGKIKSKKKYKSNTSGHVGVNWIRDREKWKASITFNGKQYFLGYYSEKEDAIRAREEAEKELFGNFLEWYEKEVKKK